MRPSRAASILLILCLFCSVDSPCSGGGPELATNESTLPGGAIPVEDALTCPLIFVGEIRRSPNYRGVALLWPLTLTYLRIPVTIKRPLKGSPNERVLVNFHVYKPPDVERIPKKDKAYVFFASEGPHGTLRVKRMLIASDDTIDLVEALIRLQSRLEQGQKDK